MKFLPKEYIVRARPRKWEIMQKIPFANLLTADSSPSATPPIYFVFGIAEFGI